MIFGDAWTKTDCLDETLTNLIEHFRNTNSTLGQCTWMINWGCLRMDQGILLMIVTYRCWVLYKSYCVEVDDYDYGPATRRCPWPYLWFCGLLLNCAYTSRKKRKNAPFKSYGQEINLDNLDIRMNMFHNGIEEFLTVIPWRNLDC
jgi:hypothetical protein